MVPSPLFKVTIKQAVGGRPRRYVATPFHSILRSVINRPPAYWRRRAGRPRRTWLRTIELDLQPHNLGLNTAWMRSQDRSKWRNLVETAMLTDGLTDKSDHDYDENISWPFYILSQSQDLLTPGSKEEWRSSGNAIALNAECSRQCLKWWGQEELSPLLRFEPPAILWAPPLIE